MKNSSLYLLLFTLSSSLIFLGFASNGGNVGDKENNNKPFEAFLEIFPDLDLPYEITAEKLQPKKENSNHKYENTGKRITTLFGAFIPGVSRASFSRRPAPSYHVEGKFKQNEDFGKQLKKRNSNAKTSIPFGNAKAKKLGKRYN
mgnify:CR=1 FL=1